MLSSNADQTLRMLNVPADPGIASRILSGISQGNIDTPQLLKLISSDPALCLPVLKYANAGLYNYPRRIGSLERAVVILGWDLVREIALYLSLKTVLLKEFPEQADFHHRLWRHSFYCALVIKVLAEQYDSSHKEQLYCCGLLHDIGKHALIIQYQEEYLLLLEKSWNEDRSVMNLEKKFLGIDHAETGAMILEKWGLPHSIVQTTRYHHVPHEFKSGDQVDFWIRLTYLGNFMAHFLEKGYQKYGDLQRMDGNFKDYLSISETDFDDLIKKMYQAVSDQREIADILNRE